MPLDCKLRRAGTHQLPSQAQIQGDQTHFCMFAWKFHWMNTILVFRLWWSLSMFQMMNLWWLGRVLLLLRDSDRNRFDFPCIFENRCFWDSQIPKKSQIFLGIFLGFSWDFLGFLGISWDFLGFLGIFWDFLGFLGISWDFLGFFGFSRIFWTFIAFLRRFWIYLPLLTVTHPYNTYERTFSHGDVYERSLLVFLVTSPKCSKVIPRFLGLIPNSWD